MLAQINSLTGHFSADGAYDETIIYDALSAKRRSFAGIILGAEFIRTDHPQTLSLLPPLNQPWLFIVPVKN